MNRPRPRTSAARVAVTGFVAAALVAALPGTSLAHSRADYGRQRAHVEKRARRQVGAPYSYGGSSPRGFDCSGFTRWVYSGHGADLPHSSMAQFEMGRRKGFKRVWKRTNLEVGDLVFHKTTGARVGHAGIYIGHGKFISSTSSGGVRVRSIWDPYYWGPRWVGATRLPITRKGPARSKHKRNRRDYRVVNRDHAGPDKEGSGG